ncbi:MAG: diguanylate cyclase [Pseudomonadota bacterium]
MNAQGRALLLENDEFDAAVIRDLIQKCRQVDLVITHVVALCDATSALARADFDVALIDLNVLDSQGLETIREVIKANPRVPIVVLSGEDDLETATMALRIGAQDFLLKSELNNSVLQRAIYYSIVRKAKENEFAAKFHADRLTGLSNRALLYERWRRSVARSSRAQCDVGVVVVNIDRFQLINERYGHAAGDALLKHLAQEFTNTVRISDVVARLGSDEFIGIVESVSQKSELDDVRSRLLENLNNELSVDGQKIPFTVRIGTVMTDPNANDDLLDVIRRADAEMYEFASSQGVDQLAGSATVVQ